MKFMRLPVRLLWLPVIVLLCAASIVGQTTMTQSAPPRSEVELEGASFQDVLNRLFGAPDTPGLLSGDKPFQLHAEDIVLTREQANTFFAPTTPNNMDFAALVSAAEQLHGQLELEGMLDGAPFELKLAGREIKLEGLSFTQAEFDSLVDRLRAISGLREFKIETTVDGRRVEVKGETRADRIKIEIEDEENEREGHERDRDEAFDNDDDHDNRGPGSLNSGRRNDHEERMERSEREEREDHEIERQERSARVEIDNSGRGSSRMERSERVEHAERPEKPESGGRGRD